MPYPDGHRAKIRRQIIRSARSLFNRNGYHSVSIDQVMAAAGLTRGGFYSYFSNKEELYVEAIAHILVEHPSEHWDGVELAENGVVQARRVVQAYLGEHHFNDIDGSCPLIAQPNDVARGSETLKRVYEQVLKSIVGIFESQAQSGEKPSRERALVIAALCVGGMVLARSVSDEDLGDEIRAAAMTYALSEGGWSVADDPAQAVEAVNLQHEPV